MDQDNARVDPADPRVVADLKELPVGSYMVEWRVISADTHPVNGTYKFTVTGAGPTESQGAAQTESASVGGSRESPSDQAEPRSDGQEGVGSIFPYILYFALGLGVVSVLVLLFIPRSPGKIRQRRASPAI